MSATRNVAAWIDSCQTRFKNMHLAGLDLNGWPALQRALKNYDDKGYFTAGEMQYLFNRTDPRGALPKYNTHKSYHKKYGNMLPCPVKDLIDSNLVNWRTGVGVMQPQLARAIKEDTRWEFRLGNLRPQTMTTFSDLFGE